MHIPDFDVVAEAQQIRAQLLSTPAFAPYLDSQRDWIPEPYGDRAQPKRLIVLGQDPTVKIPGHRDTITMVLNLNTNGNLRQYLEHICGYLNLDLDRDIYATNFAKCFFIDPPSQIQGCDILAGTKALWSALLLKELAPFVGVPVLSLGEPLLQVLVNRSGTPDRVGYYWNHEQQAGAFQYIVPGDNLTQRPLFPFPHQPSRQLPFYSRHLEAYSHFLSEYVGSHNAVRVR